MRIKTCLFLALLFALPAAASPNFKASHPRIPPSLVVDVSDAPNLSQHRLPAALAQSGSACPTGISHCVSLSWTASTSASCLSATTNPCSSFGYNVFRGTATGAESAIALNTAPITGTTFTDPITLTSNPQTFFYTVQAVETSGGISVSSSPSNEASANFPGIPTSPSGATAVPH